MKAKLAMVVGVAVVLGVGVGYLLAPTDEASLTEATEKMTKASTRTSAANAREIVYWKAPMDPNYRRDRPGKSPMGMDLVPVYADEAAGAAGMVNIDPSLVANLGVRTAVAEFGALARQVETVGYVVYDEDTLHHIHVRVEGWIEKLTVRALGDPVSKHQVLFEIYSPTLVNAQEEYLAALKSSNRLLLEASGKRLQALGVTSAAVARLDRERQVEQRTQILAPRDGVVTHLGVREGVYVTPMTDIMSIAHFDRVWVMAEVLERQAPWVEVGQQATVMVDALPGRRWQALVDYVYPDLDPITRTLSARLRFANEDGALRPNMYARVAIASPSTEAAVHIPRAALIRGGGADRVVVVLGAGKYRAQAVEAGIEVGGRVVILDGLARGETVVVSGQFLIDSESNIDSALDRLSPQDADEIAGGDHGAGG